MSLSNVKELIGLEFKPYSFGVEKGKIKELTAAIGDNNPIFSSLEAAKQAARQPDLPLLCTSDWLQRAFSVAREGLPETEFGSAMPK